jgi:hypothetical protein
MNRAMIRAFLVAATLMAVFLCAVGAHARDDGQYTNSANKEWFQSLRIPGTQTSCCDLSDCHTVDYDIKGDHYRAFIEGEWVAIPNEKVLNNVGNPVGRGVACYAKYPDTPLRILCFVPAGGV